MIVWVAKIIDEFPSLFRPGAMSHSTSAAAFSLGLHWFPNLFACDPRSDIFLCVPDPTKYFISFLGVYEQALAASMKLIL
jgi:hypothetical protein